MGWGTYVNNVYLNRLLPEQLEQELEENSDVLQSVRDEMMILAASTPRDLKDEMGNVYRWEEYVRNRMSELIDAMEDYSVRLYQCSLLKEAAKEDIEIDK